MTAAEAVALFRRWADDAHAPYLWDDAAVFGFLTLAQQDAARRARLLWEDAAAEALRRADDDDTALICSIDLVAGQARYALDPRIVALAEGERVVTIGGRALVRATGPDTYPSRTGQPETYWDTGTALVLYPVPTSADVAEPVDLAVYRLPLTDLVDEAGAFELPAAVHVGLVAGALALAYAVHDADTYDPASAQRWEAEFASWFGARIDANVVRKQRDKRPRVVRCNW
jgi:hypothetical protein